MSQSRRKGLITGQLAAQVA